jgi:uroporphyrin-III C-methyltransferase
MSGEEMHSPHGQQHRHGHQDRHARHDRFVSFVSAGPGAADLITVRGLQRLQRARVVLFDALTDPALRDHAPQARWIDVGKRGFCDSTRQAHINALLVQWATREPDVVRLKGGDAGIFGRLEEEIEALKAVGILYEVVPGVTAALAAAAAAGRPLTRRGRGRSVALTTSVTTDAQGQPVLRSSRSADTEVFYMAGRQLAALGRRLLAAGWPADTAVMVVSRAACVDQLISDHTLQGLATAAVLHSGRPTVVSVGVGAQSLGNAPGQGQRREDCAAQRHLNLHLDMSIIADNRAAGFPSTPT